MRTVLGIALAAALSGCGQSSPPVLVCTLMGCESGLTVMIEPRPAGSFRVEAAADDSVRTIECDAQRPCEGGAFFRDFTADRATIRVIVANDTTTRTVAPSYEALTPNGPECPPTCMRATVTVSLDGEAAHD